MEGMKPRAVGLPAFVATGVALFLAGLLLPASSAASGVGLTGLSRTSASPGDRVVLRVGCGGPCPLKSTYPVSLVPVKEAPQPHRCTIRSQKLPRRLRENALCAPEAEGPPHRSPYVFLGRTSGATPLLPSVRPPGSKSHLRFRVPRVAPGRYAYVIFCAQCARGPRGSLITETGLPHKRPLHKLLLVRARNAPQSSAASGHGPNPFLHMTAGLTALASAALLLLDELAAG
jgi:hypothetical protein